MDTRITLNGITYVREDAISVKTKKLSKKEKIDQAAEMVESYLINSNRRRLKKVKTN